MWEMTLYLNKKLKVFKRQNINISCSIIWVLYFYCCLFLLHRKFCVLKTTTYDIYLLSGLRQMKHKKWKLCQEVLLYCLNCQPDSLDSTTFKRIEIFIESWYVCEWINPDSQDQLHWKLRGFAFMTHYRSVMSADSEHFALICSETSSTFWFPYFCLN